ncbi:uncharacterized protein N0V89_011802 [Didymosphaeria variabile]|uniref:FHA domain-containing protein n=1 Tax=Didymosphaeria variabile TaxID=1932322 RepID=A0A9W8XAE8_9PLEO|nr:uncharacterized protein N0V89_011802 [Didymosphaeria variabile]KAJ4345667.1 hypothetical protein N0V89_011802 [Didymosphaeria variabile]
MASIIAAIVPVTDEAKEALKRGRNSVWVMPASELPESLKSAIEADCHQERYPDAIVYDVARVHTGSRKSMTFGRKRTSTVQLLSPAIEETHCALSLGPGCSLWLDNKSTQGLFTASEPGKKGDLAPNAAFELTEPTTVTMGRHGFRIYPGKPTAAMKKGTPPAHDGATHIQGKHAAGIRDDANASTLKHAIKRGRTHAKSSAISSNKANKAGPTSHEPASTHETAHHSRADEPSTITTSDDKAAHEPTLIHDGEHTATVTGGVKRKIEVGPADAGDEMGDVEEPPAKRIRQEDQGGVDWFGAMGHASLLGLSAFAVAQRFIG